LPGTLFCELLDGGTTGVEPDAGTDEPESSAMGIER
jgi:hypothetical protein